MERVEIIRDLRIGEFDVLIGINLLREGLDIPEASLVAILDADKEGFLRSERSLIQPFTEKIKAELKQRLEQLRDNNKLVEAQRLEQRTNFDVEMILELGYCNGIENYSRYLSGRLEGGAPPTLFDYLPDNAMLFVDESHVTIPQLGAMYKGDRSRKETLVEYGFRLPSALDNRPMRFDEWEQAAPQTVFISATPGFNLLCDAARYFAWRHGKD